MQSIIDKMKIVNFMKILPNILIRLKACPKILYNTRAHITWDERTHAHNMVTTAQTLLHSLFLHSSIKWRWKAFQFIVRGSFIIYFDRTASLPITIIFSSVFLGNLPHFLIAKSPKSLNFKWIFLISLLQLFHINECILYGDFFSCQNMGGDSDMWERLQVCLLQRKIREWSDVTILSKWNLWWFVFSVFWPCENCRNLQDFMLSVNHLNMLFSAVWFICVCNVCACGLKGKGMGDLIFLVDPKDRPSRSLMDLHWNCELIKRDL